MSCEKEQYENGQLAKAAASGISRRTGCSMYAYRCSSCGQWHIATAGKRKIKKPYKKPKYKK